MKQMTAGQLAQKIGYSRMQVWRLAAAGKVPGARRTKGKQFRFRDCPALNKWIAQQMFSSNSTKRVPRFMDESNPMRFFNPIKASVDLSRWLKQQMRHQPLHTWPTVHFNAIMRDLKPLAELYMMMVKASEQSRR